MKNNDWKDFGEQLKDAVDGAVNSGNFQDLSRSIGDIVNNTIDTVKTNVKESMNTSRNRQNRPYTAPQEEKAAADTPALYTKHPPGRLSAILFTSLGFTLMGISLTALIAFGIFTAIAHRGLTGLCMSAILSAAGLILGVIGVKKLNFIARFHKYVHQLKGHNYIQIRSLADKTGKPLPFTENELQKMIGRRMFYEGHLDTQGGYLIVSHKAYEEYMQAKEAYISRQKEQKQEQQGEQLSAECRKLIKDGQSYVRHIRTCNDLIPDENVSNKLDKMERLVSRIFDEVRRHPQVAPELQEMMDYYLPTTAKLLDAYRDLDTQPIEGENIVSTKKEIEAAIDTLNTAFEKLLDSLFADRAWDISSDISVLHTVLAQEGLTEDDFK